MSPTKNQSRNLPETLPCRETTPLNKLAKMATMWFLLLLLIAEGRGQTVLDDFDPNANGDVNVVVVQPDGKILIGGEFTMLSPNGGPTFARNRIARLNPDGTVDGAFDPNASYIVEAILVQPDGKILVGGSFTSIGGQLRNRIARLDATTGLADSFDPNANADVDAIVAQADGQILIGGHFNTLSPNGGGMVTRQCIARLNADGTLDTAFDAHAADNVYAIALQPDGKILVGGHFNWIGGQQRHRIARLDPVTGQADTFDPHGDLAGLVYAIALQADGKVLVGGQFQDMGGQRRNCIARLDGTTGLADSFDPSPNYIVDAIAVQADGKTLMGGWFDHMSGGQQRENIARLDPATGLADAFDPHTNTPPFSNVPVRSIAVQADGDILIGGGFTTLAPNGGATVIRNHIARLKPWLATPTPTPTATPTITPSPTASPTPIPTPTPSPTPIHTPTLTPTVTPTATPSPTASSTPVTTPTPSSTPLYTPIPTPTATPTVAPTATATPTPTPTTTPTPTATPTPAAQAINLSTRMRVQTANNVGIGGFIITGSASKHVLLRTIGPSLAQFGIPGVLADPVLELHGPGGFVTVINDNWKDTQWIAIEATGIPPTNDLESAIDATLSPGAYTAIVRGKNDTSGVALVEVYDLNPEAASKLANLSTRAFVSTESDVVIAGFLLSESNVSDRVIVRGIGPSLAPATFPASAVLANPTLGLRDGNGTLIIANNDWQDDPAQAAQLTAAGLALSNNFESGIAATLPPGLYTALLSGLDNGTGIGVVEVYDLGP